MNEYTNKQRFWLSFTAIFMIGLSTISFFLMGAWINSPTDFNINTYHTLNSDEYSASILESVKDITVNAKDISYGEKINCTVMSLYWDSNKQEYIKTDSFESSENCYAVETLK